MPALVVGLVACGPAEPPPLQDLQFWDERDPRTPGDDFFVTGKVVSAGRSYAFGAGELATLPDGPLDAIYMLYTPSTPRTDVQLFARDPQEHFDTLHSLVPCTFPEEDECACSGPLHELQWQFETTLPQLPFGVVTSVPSSAPVDLDLMPSQFWGSATPSGPGAAPNGDGSVKAARLYDHGACSLNVSLVELLDDVNDDFFEAFALEVE